MKKLLAFIIVVSMSLCTFSCTSEKKPSEKDMEDDDLEDTENSDIVEDEETECEHEYKELIYRQASYGVKGGGELYCTKCGDYQPLEIPALPSVFELEVTGKNTYTVDKDPDNGSDEDLECWVLFDMNIKNISDKTIEKISGTLNIFVGKSMFFLECEFEDLNLEGGETLSSNSYGYSFDYASSPDEVERIIYDAEFEDLKIFFEPTEVIVKE